MPELIVYAKTIAELIALAKRLRDEAKKAGVTDAELDAAIDEFNPEKYADPLK